MVKDLEWRGGVNERFTGVEKADLAGRGGYRVGVDKTSPWHTPRARSATERDGERNGMACGVNEKVYGCGKKVLSG